MEEIGLLRQGRRNPVDLGVTTKKMILAGKADADCFQRTLGEIYLRQVKI